MSAEETAIENPYAGQGTVLLDIGGDIGALVVEMPREMLGVEIEIRPAGSAPAREGRHSHHPHVAVVDRPTADGTSMPSLVFGNLREGSYELYEKGGGRVWLTTAVTGSEITQLTWPTA